MTGPSAQTHPGVSRSGSPATLTTPAVPPQESIEDQLRRLLASRILARSRELCRFLRFVVEQTLRNRGVRLKEYLIGIAVFERGDSFNPATDPIVRVQARRLRAKLAQYYETEGRGDTVRIELPSGRYVPQFSYRDASRSSSPAAEAPPSFLPTLEEIAAPRIARPNLSRAVSPHAGDARPQSYLTYSEAYDFCRRARMLVQQPGAESIRQGIMFFEHAVQAEPGWGPAYAGLAATYAQAALVETLPAETCLPAARSLAAQALDLDARSAEAHAASALVRALYDWDFAGAEKQFRKALDLGPGLAPVHDWYAVSTLIPSGQLDHAVLELKVALEFAPASIAIQTDLAWALYLSRRLDEALDHCQYALASGSAHFRPHYVLGLIHEARSNFDVAAGSYERAERLFGDEPAAFLIAALGHAAAMGGKITQAFELLGRLTGRSDLGPVSLAAATVLMGIGDVDAVFEWLDKAAAARESGLIWIGADPRFERLRTDPRFVALISRLRPAEPGPR